MSFLSCFAEALESPKYPKDPPQWQLQDSPYEALQPQWLCHTHPKLHSLPGCSALLLQAALSGREKTGFESQKPPSKHICYVEPAAGNIESWSHSGAKTGSAATPNSPCYSCLVSQEPQCKGTQKNACSQFVPRDLETFPAGWVGTFTYGLPALETPPLLTTLLAPWMCFFS